jgi:hypothetical protein
MTINVSQVPAGCDETLAALPLKVSGSTLPLCFGRT